MEYAEKLIKDLFAMEFDIVFPLSGSIIAVFVAVIFFSIRYFVYKKNCRRFADEQTPDLPYHRKEPKKTPETVVSAWKSSEEDSAGVNTVEKTESV